MISPIFYDKPNFWKTLILYFIFIQTSSTYPIAGAEG
jgi:hypothetical protein